MTAPTSFTYKVHGDVMTTNEARKLRHWSTVATITRFWREGSAAAAADKVGEWLEFHGGPVPVRIEAMPFTPKHPQQDVGACHPTTKACIDGLVDAGLVPDDTADWVRYLGYLPQCRIRDMPEAGMWITVIRVEDPTPDTRRRVLRP